MHLRHRHRDAAGEPGDDEQRLQRARGQPERMRRARRRHGAPVRMIRERRLPAQQQRERQHARDAEDADADIRGSPAGAADEVLDDRRPHGAGEVVAARDDRDRDAAPAREPQRRVGEERREGRRAAGADQHAVRQGEIADRRRQRGGRIAGGKQQRAERDGNEDAETIGQPPHPDAGQPEADHRQRVGQRRVRARDAEFRLHGGQRDDDRPHADAADGGEGHRHQQAQPCSRRVNDGVRFVRRYIHAWKPDLSLRW